MTAESAWLSDFQKGSQNPVSSHQSILKDGQHQPKGELCGQDTGAGHALPGPLQGTALPVPQCSPTQKFQTPKLRVFWRVHYGVIVSLTIGCGWLSQFLPPEVGSEVAENPISLSSSS